MKIPAELMEAWYGKRGKLAKSGFTDIETFDDSWEPEDALAADPSSPNLEPVDIDVEHIVEDQYSYFLCFRRGSWRLSELKRWTRERDHQDVWLVSWLWGEGEPLKDIALFVDMSTSSLRRLIYKLEHKWGVRDDRTE